MSMEEDLKKLSLNELRLRTSNLWRQLRLAENEMVERLALWVEKMDLARLAFKAAKGIKNEGVSELVGSSPSGPGTGEDNSEAAE